MRHSHLWLFLITLAPPLTPLLFGQGEIGDLDPLTIESRDPESAWREEGGYSGQSLDTAALQRLSGATLDDQLASRNGLRLFRRQSSLTAHPTTQSVSMRIAGPNGASRTQVYKDGIPINDAFGGWVPWGSLPARLFSSVQMAADPGVDPWGHSSLGGSLSLASRYLEAPTSFAELSVETGKATSFGTTGFFAIDSASGKSRLFGGFSIQDADGYPVIRERGTVDRDATLQNAWGELGWRWEGNRSWALTVRAEGYDEARGNGTALADNTARSFQSSARLTKARSGDAWASDTVVYYQQQNFASMFTRVDAARETELPVLDQFAVPSEALGVESRNQFWLGEEHRLTLTADSRWVGGETRERFRNLGDGFTRGRAAGGEQWETGLGLQHRYQPAALPDWELHSSIRLAHSRRAAGFLDEWDLATHERLLDERPEDHVDWGLSYRLALQWHATEAVTLRTATFAGERHPTLNELYRPFRVGNDITLANPGLDSERVWGVSLGGDWDPAPNIRLTADFFYHRLEDGVANVVQASGPGNVDPFGFIPAGGTGGRRENIDDIRLLGVDLSLGWDLNALWHLDFGYVYTDTKVRESRAQADLKGKSLAQAPEQQAYAALSFDSGSALAATLQARGVGEVFEDNLNTRTLDAFLQVDIGARWRFHEAGEVYLSVENLLNEEIETRRDSSGLVSIGAPRLWRLGYRRWF